MKIQKVVIFCVIFGAILIISLVTKKSPEENKEPEIIEETVSQVNNEYESQQIEEDFPEFEGSPYDDPDFVEPVISRQESGFIADVQTRTFGYINELREEVNKPILQYNAEWQKYVNETIQQRAFRKSTESDEYDSKIMKTPGYVTADQLFAIYDFERYIDCSGKYLAVAVYYGQQQDCTYLMILTANTEYNTESSDLESLTSEGEEVL